MMLGRRPEQVETAKQEFDGLTLLAFISKSLANYPRLLETTVSAIDSTPPMHHLSKCPHM
jgi:hypothetical protein